MTIQTQTTDLLFPEATPLFGDLPAKLKKAWVAYGARLAIAAISLCLSLEMANGVIASITSAGTLV
jgi:hypothetical protein